MGTLLPKPYRTVIYRARPSEPHRSPIVLLRFLSHPRLAKTQISRRRAGTAWRRGQLRSNAGAALLPIRRGVPAGGSVKRSAERAKAARILHCRRVERGLAATQAPDGGLSAPRASGASTPWSDIHCAVKDELCETANARPRDLAACVPQHDTHRRALRFAAKKGARAVRRPLPP